MSKIRERLNIFLGATLFATSLFFITACPDDGPFEDAGEKIDEAVDEVEDAID